MLKEEKGHGVDCGSDGEADEDPDDEKYFLIFVISSYPLHERVKDFLVILILLHC